MIYVFLAPGFEEIEALTPVDVLRRGGLEVQTVAVTDDPVVPGSHGIPVRADVCIRDLDPATLADAQMLILPGGLPGATNLRACQPLCDALLAADAKSTPIAAICAAPFILADLGILRGRMVTCYPTFAKELHAKGAIVVPMRVFHKEHLLTASGMGVALEFSLAALEMLTDQATVEQIAKSIEKKL